MMKKALALISIVVLLAMTSSVCDAVAPILSVTPNNSNIFQVNGSGFAPNETVTLALYNSSILVYTFPSMIANSTGSFSGIEIVPTSIIGALYNLTATGLAINTTATILFNVPNLRGLQGISGLNGQNGANGTNGLDFNSTGTIILHDGAKGDPGQSIVGPAGPTSPLVYVGLAISLLALAVVVWEKRGEKTE